MLSDFGLVKLFGDGKKTDAATSLTGSGAGIGTPDYMAPEQWTGEATQLSDLYSLGVVLYEMITGHRPFSADTPAGVLLKQATESLPLPKQYVPDLPQAVESVLLNVLAREAAHRYPSVRAFADELQDLLAGRQVSASTIKTERLREQMTGKVERHPAAPASQPTLLQKKVSLSPLVILGGIGAFVLLAALGGYWLVFGQRGAAKVEATATQTAAPPPTVTEAPLTPTNAPTDSPTPVPAPTQTSIPLEITDSRNVAMRLVPAGTFTMGSDDTGDIGSRPAHEVNVAAFYIDKYEVTNEMYDACVYAGECRRPLQTGSVTRTTYYSNPVFAKYPVIYVDWKMAKMYCEWRGARLPTEAEWEKAARGTDARIYPWGTDKLDCSLANYFGCFGDTTPVDQHTAGQSVYGVFGMAGNVWEWTSSLFKLYPYNATDGREDLKAAGERVVRGGSWHAFGGNGGNVRTDTRLKLDPAYAGAYVGIRCALTR
jgi:serine/threonine-protein kinase